MNCRQILVVDSNRAVQLVLRGKLEERGYEVTYATDGLEALRLLTQPRPLVPDVILLDLKLPGMNGWEFLGIQKSTPALSRIPTLVYSPEPVTRPFNPATPWVRKSPDYEELFETLDRVCGQASERGQAS